MGEECVEGTTSTPTPTPTPTQEEKIETLLPQAGRLTSKEFKAEVLMPQELSVFNRTFWNLWLMKLFRNIASVKYQWLLFLYIPTIWGMFHINEKTNAPWISSMEGLAFLGGGFLTLATSRLIAQSSLIEDSESINTLNTDK
jgi:hypothetical protein